MNEPSEDNQPQHYQQPPDNQTDEQPTQPYRYPNQPPFNRRFTDSLRQTAGRIRQSGTQTFERVRQSNTWHRIQQSGTQTFERVRQPGTWSGLSTWLYQQLRELVAGISFSTTVPIPGSSRLFRNNEVEPRPVIGTAYFPFIGLLIALVLCLIPLLFGGNFLFNAGLPGIALAALVIVAEIALTGGLHLDGLMDSFDGLFGGRTRENKLEIMQDSRVGSFGILGAAAVLLLKLAFLSSLSIHQLPLALLVVLPTARAAMIVAVAAFPPARPSGLGATFHQTLTRPRLIAVIVTSLLIALIFGRLAGIIAWVISLLIAYLIGLWLMRSIQGQTGDTYGMTAEVCEVAALLVLVLLRMWL
jgi:adenosylcobinamide-GDP ribazoletransferase